MIYLFLRHIYRKVIYFKLNFFFIFSNHKKKFTYIFKSNIWGSVESISGPGSELQNTKNIRSQIPLVISKFNINSIIDIPCGDYNWFKEIDRKIIYVGADIVDSIINLNNLNYENSNTKFIKHNIIIDKIDRYDLIIVRDLFIHFSDHDINKALNNIINSGSKYLLTTYYNDTSFNKSIITGNFRELNLLIEPFNFPKPLFEIDDTGLIKKPNSDLYYKNKMLSLFLIKDLNK